MTKLYHNGDVEGWQIPGKQDKKAERVDVPSSPPELVAWLNHRRVGPTGAAAAHERNVEALGVLEELEPLNEAAEQLLAETKAKLGEKIPGHCQACGRSAAGALKLQLGNELEQLEDWLETIDAGNLWALERAAESIRARVRSIGGRLDEGGNA